MINKSWTLFRSFNIIWEVMVGANVFVVQHFKEGTDTCGTTTKTMVNGVTSYVHGVLYVLRRDDEVAGIFHFGHF